MRLSREAPLRRVGGRGVGIGIGLIAREPYRRSRLSRVLSSAGIECRASAETFRGLRRVAGDLDVVVLDDTGRSATLPARVRETREALPHALLIVVCSPFSIGDARRTLRAGAAALISEPELDHTLGASIEAVRCGLICVPRAMRAPLESETLSMREKQVLGMVVMGLTNADIAAKLYLAESTVKSHLSSAYSKLGVRTRKEAASMILDPTEGLGPGILATWAATGVASSNTAEARSESEPRPGAQSPTLAVV